VVTTLFKYARLQPARSVAMVCGPEIMMRFVTQELRAQGLSRENIHFSMERNMKCAVGFCGHCQYGPHFICKDGPVFRYEQLGSLLGKYEL
jgi:NAD(P)H-flavin reductase